MAVKFIPVRGTEEKIQASEYQDGYIYFATDSGKIYVDSQGERTTMGAAGAAVYFGSQDKVHENEDTGYFEIPKVTISGSPKPGDLILNSDGGFYKVVSVGTEICVCTLLTVSGGGGNVLGGLRPSITLNVENTNLLNG